MERYSNIIMEKAWTRINNVRAFSINESATDRYIDRLICENLPDNLKEYANTTVDELVSKNIVNAMALGTTDEEIKERKDESLKDYIRINICRDFDIYHGHGPVKYMRGIFRIVILEFNYLIKPNRNLIENFKSDVLYISESVKNGMDEDAMALDGNFNGMSSEEIHDMFYEKRKAYAEKLRNDILSNFNSGKESEYDVIPMNSYKDCKQYSKYTTWCITHSKANYDAYTKGARRFYFFLKHDFKDIWTKDTKNAPLDEYGLSMISILINGNGDIEYITTRYNHEHDGEYNRPDPNTIIFFQNVIGMNLYDVCKPYTEEELEEMGLLTPDMAMKRVNNGEPLEKVFDYVYYDDSNGYAIVSLHSLYLKNILDTNKKPVLKKWVENLRILGGGYYAVTMTNSSNENAVDTHGKILFKKGYRYITEFSNGLFTIMDYDSSLCKNMYYCITLDEEVVLGPLDYLSPFCYRYAIGCKMLNSNKLNNFFILDTSLNIKHFKNEYADMRIAGDANILKKVKNKPFCIVSFLDSDGHKKTNLIDINENFLLDNEYVLIEEFTSRDNKILCKVGKDGKTNFLNKDLKLLSDIWFDYAYILSEKGSMADNSDYFINVTLNNKHNMMSYDGKFLLDIWSDKNIIYSVGDYYHVKHKNKHNLANKYIPNDFYFDEWVDYIDDNDEMRLVKKDGKFNYMDSNYNYILDTWLDDADSFSEACTKNGVQYTRMCMNGEYNFFNNRFEPLFAHGFEYATPFKNSKSAVKVNGKYNVINKSGKFLFNNWYDGISTFRNGFAIVELNGEFNFIDKNGNILCDRWFYKVKPFTGEYAKVYIKNYDSKIRAEYYVVDKKGNYYGPYKLKN